MQASSAALVCGRIYSANGASDSSEVQQKMGNLKDRAGMAIG